MGKVIVVQFVTADGVIQDPDGSAGTAGGGWAYRFGFDAIAGDKFHTSDSLDTGAMLFGRATWQVFSTRWPVRTDEFSSRMNRARKVVVSRTLDDVTAWDNSSVTGDLETAVADLRPAGDIVVIGSTSVMRQLAAADLVDEYRLLVFPVVLGHGERMFADAAIGLRLCSVEQTGPLAMIQYEVDRSA